MKKLIQFLFVAVMFATNNVYSQNDFSFVANSADGKTYGLPVNELNAKAVRHFTREFAPVENESWFKVSDGYIAKFKMNNIQYRVGYDKKGNWLNTIKTYQEKEFSLDMRSLVKSNYYDYAITLIEEVTSGTQTVYVVHIENETGCKKLSLVDGEITVMEELWK